MINTAQTLKDHQTSEELAQLSQDASETRELTETELATVNGAFAPCYGGGYGYGGCGYGGGYYGGGYYGGGCYGGGWYGGCGIGFGIGFGC